MQKKILYFVVLTELTRFFFISTDAIAHDKNQLSLLTPAQQLGWVNAANICHGYFLDDPKTLITDWLPPEKASTLPVTLSADKSELSYDGVSTLSGNIRITQQGRTASAQTARLLTQEGSIDSAELQGNVILRTKGQMSIAKTAVLDLKKKWYQLTDVFYRLAISDGLSAWGSATEATEHAENTADLNNITYSTCSPENWTWHLSAKKLHLNQATGRGQADDAVFYINHWPVFYTPYFNFPLDNRRQSGLLYPKFIFGSHSGFGWGIPFYWNIASNQDDTFTPYFYTKRGFLINNQYRYLTQSNRGELNLSLLPNDRAFRDFQKTEPSNVPSNTPGTHALISANPMRSLISWRNYSTLGGGWSNSINYTRVSDDYYPQDINDVPLVSQNQILQQGQFLYTGKNVDFLANFQGYQTLHPINQAFVYNQYNMLPQLLFTTHLTPEGNQLNYQMLAELVNFSQTKNPGQLNQPPAGQRLNMMPSLSLPLMGASGFITPKITYALTRYHLSHLSNGPVASSSLPTQITRTLPIVTLDSGLYFERALHLLNHDYQQTVEPRLFYLYAPFRNQSDIPIFDTSLQPFGFNQLFSENRFSSIDRISDANQISMALSSRLLDNMTGNEKLSAHIGVIKYFNTRQVSLCGTSSLSDCLKTPFSLAEATYSRTAEYSPVVAELNYQINPNWQTDINIAWDTDTAQTQNAGIFFQYKPLSSVSSNKKTVFNLGYNFLRYGDFFTLPSNAVLPTSSQQNKLNNYFNLSQPSTSIIWPINDRWRFLGSFSYSLNQHHPLTYFGGLEYDTCCWGIQTVLAKSFAGFDAFATAQYNTGIYVQLVFKGLSKMTANDSLGLLNQNIRGYEDII